MNDITKYQVERSDVCEPAKPGSIIFVNGQWEKVICTLDGENVTWRMLKNIITGKYPPVSELMKGFMV